MNVFCTNILGPLLRFTSFIQKQNRIFSVLPYNCQSMAITYKSIALSIITQLCLVSCVLSQQNETQFLYHGFFEANLLKYGSSKILPSGILELTNSSRRQMGQAFYGFPVPFNNTNSSNSLSFSTSFVFSIDAPGHGLTFLISPSMDFTQAMPSQFLGLFNTSNNGNSTNRILAVEFDTVKSNEFLDIDDNHVGIDVNGLVSVESAPAAFFSNKQNKNISLKLSSKDPIRAWIDTTKRKCFSTSHWLLLTLLNLNFLFYQEIWIFLRFSWRKCMSDSRHPPETLRVIIMFLDGALAEKGKHKTLISLYFLRFQPHRHLILMTLIPFQILLRIQQP